MLLIQPITALPYFYDSKVSGSARGLTDFAGGPRYISLTVATNGTTKAISVSASGVRSSSLVIEPQDTTTPLTIEKLEASVICTVDTSGNLAQTGILVVAVILH